MDTLQVQSAGAVAPTLPASTGLGGTPTAGDSFALTLGRALENLPSSVLDGFSIAPKASPREKRDAADTPDSTSMAGILFNAFVADITQPVPSVALSTKAPESTVSLQSPAAESTSDSPPNFDSGFTTLAGETSANTGTLSVPVAMGSGAAPSALSAWAGKSVRPTGTAKAEASRSTARERGQVADLSSALVSTTGQNRSEDTATPQSVSPPAWLPGLQDTSLLSQSVEQQVGGALSASKQAQASNPGSAQESETRQESLASPTFTVSWPQLEQLDPAQMQAAPQPPSTQGLQAASNPTLSLGQTEQAAPACGPQTSDPSTPLSATDHPAPSPEASVSSTPFSATDHPELAEFSSRLGKFVGADLQAASNPTLSLGQTEQATPASRPKASDPSTPFSATDHPAMAEFSSRLGKFAGADLQAASNPTLSLDQTEQATPASRPKASVSSTPFSVTDHPAPSPQATVSSTPFSATDHPALAEFSSRLGKFAGADLQAASNPTLSLGQTEQATPAPGPEASDSSIPVSATDRPELAEFSSRLGKFAGAEISLKVSGNGSPQATAPEKSTTGSAPVAVDALSSGLRETAVDSAQIPAAPKSENLVITPAKGTLHSAPVSSSVATEAAWQKGKEPEAATVQIPLPSSASPVPPQRLDASSQPVAPATTLQKDAAPQAYGTQPTGAVPADSGESAAHANLADSSASGPGKSGQQRGPGSGDNPPGFKTSAPYLANNPAADSTGNLLTAHAPSIPANHADILTPQSPPSSTQPPRTLTAWQNYDGGPGKIVQSASLTDTAKGAEMRVELRSGTLGPLEVHAVLNEGSLGAEIRVQGREAHTLLTAGLPSLERSLGERNLHVENIAVYQDQAGGGMSGGEKQDSQSGSSPTPQHQVLPWDSPPQPPSAASRSAEDEESADPAAGLSVRA